MLVKNSVVIGLIFSIFVSLVLAKDKNVPLVSLREPGKSFPVDYERFGEFSGVGTNDYKYKIRDREGLSKAVGESIYPNIGLPVTKGAEYKAWKKKNLGRINAWDYVNTGDPASEYFAWSQASGIGPGTKLFFTAQALAEAGQIKQALKAYYAILIHFPKEPCWAQDRSFVWYVAEVALGRIEDLLNSHPEIGYELEGAYFRVMNAQDTDLNNDQFVVEPGQWVKSQKAVPVDVSKLKIVGQRGSGRVKLVKFNNEHWQLRVDNKPYFVRGVTYAPTPVGKHLADVANQWMFNDDNDDGLVDVAYQSFVDANNNGRQDSSEPDVGDFELMRQMGVNTIRIYQNDLSMEYNPNEFNKKLLRDLHSKYGISVIMGHFLGAYTVGSGASWEDGTDYTDPVQLENMRTSVRQYVLDHRNEPYVLMWLLGNENLMPSDYTGVNATRTNASSHVKEYLTFVNDIADMIHKLDPDHPVAVGNIDSAFLEEHAQYAPAVDIFGANSYRGPQGFGYLFKRSHKALDRPVLITEYGCDAWDQRKSLEDQDAQAKYHESNWKSIVANSVGQSGVGNSIGGIAFEWLDEWWKSPSGSPKLQDTNADSPMAFPDGWAHEEWFGLMSQGKGDLSPFLRRPRKSYELYRDVLWKTSEE